MFCIFVAASSWLKSFGSIWRVKRRGKLCDTIFKYTEHLFECFKRRVLITLVISFKWGNDLQEKKIIGAGHSLTHLLTHSITSQKAVIHYQLLYSSMFFLSIITSSLISYWQYILMSKEMTAFRCHLYSATNSSDCQNRQIYLHLLFIKHVHPKKT
jgi:hypothetical protein